MMINGVLNLGRSEGDRENKIHRRGQSKQDQLTRTGDRNLLSRQELCPGAMRCKLITQKEKIFSFHFHKLGQRTPIAQKKALHQIYNLAPFTK